MITVFHRSVALDNAFFCNRTKELTRLADNIQRTLPTVLIYPRRLR